MNPHPPPESPSPDADGPSDPVDDVRGASRLVVDAVVGVTDVVEAMHRTISGLAPPVGPSREGRTRGITGFVYRSIRRLSQGIGGGLDRVLAHLGRAQTVPRRASHDPSSRREAVVAALNGVVGDHLAASNNPLALRMRMHAEGRAWTLDRHAPVAAPPAPASRLLVFVHGLCMNDLQWTRNGHRRSAALARRLGAVSLYLHYNTGRPIATNGRAFADLLERLVANWPVPVRDLVVIGHSMGGLVARSAWYYGSRAGHAWRNRSTKLIFLGTPHHGAPLERVGHWVDRLMDVSPYTAPLARIGHIRSAGVKDLRDGTIIDARENRDGAMPGMGPDTGMSLPEGVDGFAIAASRQQTPDGSTPDLGTASRLAGDGLVTVPSALGLHASAARSLRLPTARRRVYYGMNHFDLLDRREVYNQIHQWCAEA